LRDVWVRTEGVHSAVLPAVAPGLFAVLHADMLVDPLRRHHQRVADLNFVSSGAHAR